jgi:hypothetical protein
MPAPPHGIERVRRTAESYVLVSDGRLKFEMRESRYREKGYQPPVEQLPWRNERNASPR